MSARSALRASRAVVNRLSGVRPRTLGADLAPARNAVRFAVGRSCLPPTFAKRAHLLRLLDERHHRVFVEAGTYLGDTVEFFSHRVARVISVELHDGLFERAAERFAGVPNVDIQHGDALELVPAIVAGLADAPLVWLDGHYSGEGTAEGTEVEPAAAILTRLGPVSAAGTTVVIDDLRLFGHPQFARLEDLVHAAATSFPHARVRTGLDSLVIEA
ncbi:MAG: hypothetical protein Q8K79_16730 [Solirubrobacteraceae bacterium]|nr:hypothetical protein [Solirubrobacteraceae bacterium]